MKTIRLFLLSLLTIAFAMPTAAQVIENGEAFYIYRNDGNFDGFFYDEVKEIRYSKLDLDSIIHDDYVVQEVVLKDTIHRIPLAVIDSVGFVQPKIIYSPKLKHMDELGITQYARAGFHDFIFYLDKTIPDNLLPKVGDVVISTDKSRFGIDVFGGKITQIGTSNGSWELMLEEVSSLEDIFVQFISIEQVKTDQHGNIRRRMAGLNGARRADGNFDATLFNFAGTIKKEFKPNGSEGTLALTFDTEVTLGLAMTYYITWKKLFVKATMSEYISVGVGASATVDGTIERSVPIVPDALGALKFPAVLPLFETRPFPELFARLHGEISAKLAFPKMTYSASQTVIFDNSAEQMISGAWRQNKIPEEEEKSFLEECEAGFTVSGFVQFGLKNILAIQTNNWIDKVFSASFGVDVYTGPKLSGELSFSPTSLATSGCHGPLENSKVNVTFCSIDMEGKAKMKYLWNDEKTNNFFESSLKIGDFEFYLLPKISNFTIDFDKIKEKVACHFDIDDRRMLSSCELGIQLHAAKNTAVPDNLKDEYFLSYNTNSAWAKEGLTCEFQNLYAAHYIVQPITKIFGMELSAASYKSFCVEPYLILEGPEAYFLSSSGGCLSIKYESNAAPYFLVASVPPPLATVVDHENKTVHIYYPENTQEEPEIIKAYIRAESSTNNGGEGDIVPCEKEITLWIQGSGG